MPRVEQPKPEPGQVWADNDVRSKGRMVRIDEVVEGGGEPFVVATIVANDSMVQSMLDRAEKDGRRSSHADRRGKKTQIKVRRLRPSTTGYRLVHEADPRLPGFPLCSCSRSADAHENDCPQVLYSPDDI